MAIDPKTLSEVLDYYGTWLEFSRRYLRVPGVQAAVYADDRIAYSGAYGQADVEQDAELTEQHLFRIASHSKTFTATAVMQLVERDQLRLDDKAGHHVTELAGTPAGELTVRDLLSHAGGVVRDSGQADFWQLQGEFPDRDELVGILRDSAAAVLPSNERFKYSNIGYGLLGLVLEAAGGAPYNELVRTAIIEKLGLSDLGPELDPARSREYAAGYSALSYAGHRVPIDHVDTRALAAATGFYATAHDLVSYFAAHLPGDERLLTDASKRVMQHPLRTIGAKDDGPRYALGLQVIKVGDQDVFGHGGGYPGHITRSLVDPERRIVVSVLTNAIDGPAQQLAEGLLKLLDLAESEDSGSTEEDAGDLTRFTGRFANLWGVTDIALLGGRLYALDPTSADPAAEPVVLEVDSESTLRVKGGVGYGAVGEVYRYAFKDGKVASLRSPGQELHPLADYTLPDRVTLSGPPSSE